MWLENPKEPNTEYKSSIAKQTDSTMAIIVIPTALVLPQKLTVMLGHHRRIPEKVTSP